MSGLTSEQWLSEIRTMAAQNPSREPMQKMLNAASPVSRRTMMTDKGFHGTPQSGVGVDMYVKIVTAPLESQ